MCVMPCFVMAVVGVLAMYMTRTVVVRVVGMTMPFAIVWRGFFVTVAVAVLGLAVCAGLARGHHRAGNAAAFRLVKGTRRATVIVAAAVSLTMSVTGAVVTVMRGVAMAVTAAVLGRRGGGRHEGSVGGRQHAIVRVHFYLLCL